MTRSSARVGGAVGALGLAAHPRPRSLLAPRRSRGVGRRVRDARRLACPGGPPARLRRRRRSSESSLRAARHVALRPLAVAARGRRARLRAGAHPGLGRLDEGEPAAADLPRRRRGRARARVAALLGRRPHCASSARSPGRSRCSSAGAGSRSSGRRIDRGRARSTCSSSCCRSACSRSRSRACRGGSAGSRAVRPARADGRSSSPSIGDLAVPDAEHVLEPEGRRRQRLRAEQLVLPRQLGLLRPVDLRPLPRRRDPREPRARALRPACGWRGRRCAARS